MDAITGWLPVLPNNPFYLCTGQGHEKKTSQGLKAELLKAGGTQLKSTLRPNFNYALIPPSLSNH